MEGAQLDSSTAAATGVDQPRGPVRRFGDRAAYLALRGLWALLTAVGLKRARWGLEGVAGLFERFDRRHRRVVEENLEIAFPGMDPAVRSSIVRDSFRNWGRLGAETVHSERIIESARSSPEWEALAAAVAEGRAAGHGLLLLTAHIGNFEVLARLFGSLVSPVAVLHRPLGIAEVDAFLVGERRRLGVTSLGRGAAIRSAMRILAEGGCVAVPLDQNQRRGHGIFINVLGHPACTSTVLARLSQASGAPVLPVFGIWRDSRTVPVIGELIQPPPRGGAGEREGTLRERTALYGAEVDRVVRRFPHQWNWAHRRWKTRPDG